MNGLITCTYIINLYYKILNHLNQKHINNQIKKKLKTKEKQTKCFKNTILRLTKLI